MGLLNYILHPTDSMDKINKQNFRSNRYRETFELQQYYWLYQHIKPNTTLIDIGANIGDTAIYFAMHPNVKQVIAYEPFPKAVAMAKESIEHSPLKDKITFINKAVAEKHDTRTLDPNNYGVVGKWDDSYEHQGVEVESVILAEVLKGHKNIAIKCDCEGAEAEIFKDTNMKNVYAMQIEYHRNLEIVEETLKGFKLEVDFYPYHDPSANEEAYEGVGWIYAEKKVR